MRGRTHLWPGEYRWQSLVLGLGFLIVAALGYVWGRAGQAQALALPPAPSAQSSSTGQSDGVSSDYSKRIVATIFGNISITREELGEYLIAHYGSQKVELLVNKRIIDHYCRERGIEVTAAEIEASLEDDIKAINVDRARFVNNVLKQYNKTLLEWQEDVIRPRLLLSKLCRDQVQATPEDMQRAFEAHYGEKVEGRIILWRENEYTQVLAQHYGKIRDSEQEFDQMARHQASVHLAGTGGRVPAFGRNSTGDDTLEKEAFNLQPGELSSVLKTPQGILVFKCDKRIPPDPKASLTDPKIAAELEKEIISKKVQMEIPNIFKKMREQADAKFFISLPETEEELKRNTAKLYKETAAQDGLSAGQQGPKRN